MNSVVKNFIIVSMLLFSVSGILVYAETAEELRNKINQSNSEISKLEEEIRSYQSQIATVGNQANTLSNQIKQLDLTRKKLLTDITITEKKITTTNLKIRNLGNQISDKKTIIKEHKGALAETIKTISESDSTSTLTLLLSQGYISDAWRDFDNLESFQSKVKESIVLLQEDKKDLEDNRTEAEDVRQELINLQSELGDRKKIIDQNTVEKNRLLRETKNQESNYKKILEQSIVRKKAFEQELRDYESKLKFVLDPNSIPAYGSGVLNWPIDNVYITQQFGSTSASKRLYTSGTHNGVDFRASVGTPVKAMLSGVVVGTGDTDVACPRASFGKWVLVKYTNGLSSTYAHLSLIKVSPGQQVRTGDIIGYSGNTGYSTGPHLHVSVYASSAVSVQSRPSASCSGKTYTMPIAPINAYLDPLGYLPRL